MMPLSFWPACVINVHASELVVASAFSAAGKKNKNRIWYVAITNDSWTIISRKFLLSATEVMIFYEFRSLLPPRNLI